MCKVHVFACGPSIKYLLQDDWSKEKTIGCNGVGLLGLKINTFCACDRMPDPVVKWAETFPGFKFVSAINQDQFERAAVIKHWPSQGPLPYEEAEMRGFYWHGSVAMMACEIARLLMDAETIVIHGLDYLSNEHAYDSISPELKRKEAFWDMPLLERNWKSVWLNYQKYGVQIWNANPNSALQALPKLDDWRVYTPPERVSTWVR